MVDIADYDKSKYDYEQYWINRQYEDLSERIALKKMISNISTKRCGIIADLGCGYGRLLPVYFEQFRHIILFDYSLELLRKAHNIYKNKQNISYILGNVYKMPFKDKSIDVVLLVRVLHHIEDVFRLFREFERVVRFNLIIDCPNKRHFISILRGLFTGSLKEVLSNAPYKQPPKKSETISGNVKQIFYNYNPKWIEKIANDVSGGNLTVSRILSVSNLRNPFVKKMVPLFILKFLEDKLQKPFSYILFGPSIWMLFSRRPANVPKADNKHFSLRESLLCPACHSDLVFNKTEFFCNKCNKSYRLLENSIWDFRVN